MPSECGGYTVVAFCLGFPGGSEVKAPACNLGYLGSVPGLGRFPEEGNGNPLQYSCLENPMDRGAWWATVHGVTKSQTQLSDFLFFRAKVCHVCCYYFQRALTAVLLVLEMPVWLPVNPNFSLQTSAGPPSACLLLFPTLLGSPCSFGCPVG